MACMTVFLMVSIVNNSALSVFICSFFAVFFNGGAETIALLMEQTSKVHVIVARFSNEKVA